MQSVALLIVGDEVLAGEVEDQNTPYALGAFTNHGVTVRRVVLAPDDPEVLFGEVRRLRPIADALVISGGIGPTHDDQTRPALAAALGLDLVTSEEAVRRIQGFYGDATTEAELSMAEVPEGSRIITGKTTDVFGFAVAGIYALPGVPFLFRDLVDGLIADFDGSPLTKAEIRTEQREGEVAVLLADVQSRHPDVAIGSYPVFEDGTWHVRVVLRGADPAAVEALAEGLRAELG